MLANLPSADTLFTIPQWNELGSISLRLLLAAVLGAIIGWEREQLNRAAGLRTHILVSMGCALFVLSPVITEMTGDAQSRIMQGVIQGIGFLGAGTIVKLTDKAEVKGLTSAASIWCVAAIGLAAGVGALWMPVMATLVVWLVLRPLGAMEKHIKDKNPNRDGVTGA